MSNKLLMALTLMGSVISSQMVFAEEMCESDKDCKDGNVCILVLTPPVCKPPQPAGEPCIRDLVCASKKCEMPDDGKPGVCK